jgi:PAS domain S-box-containing protein
MTFESLQAQLEQAKAALSVAKDQIINLNKEIELLKGGHAPKSIDQSLSALNTARLESFISGCNDGIVVTDEAGRVSLSNEVFCRQFRITATPDFLIGLDFITLIEKSRSLFKDPAQYVAATKKIAADRKPVFKDEFMLNTGMTYYRDSMPVFVDGVYKGQLWKFTDATRNKTIESTFESQRNFYEQILNNVPGSIAVLNPQRKYIFVNPVAVSDTEVRKWLIGKNDEEYCQYRNKPMSLAETRKKVFEKVVSSKREVEWEEKFVSGSRTEYHLRKMYPVFDATGMLEIVISYGVDITERKKIEEQIAVGQKRYKDIFNYSQAWICSHDLNGKLLSINPAACQILEFEATDLIGHTIDSLMPEKVKQEFKQQYLHKIATEGKADGIMRILNRHGKTLFLLYQNYLVNEPDSEPYVIGFAQNITQRIYAEEALKRSEEKYRGIIENINLGMLEIDPDEKIIYANQRFCEMSGYSPKELIGQMATELLLHGAGLKMTRTQLSKQLYGSSHNYELAIKTKNGEDKWWLTSATPLYNSDGTTKGTIGIHLDITDQKKMQQQLKEAKAVADKSSVSKDLFMTNMSHEIRTPLNAIMGLGKLLNKSDLSSQQKQYLAGIESASENLLSIVNDLLDFSKIEAGKITIEHISLNLEQICNQSLDILRHKADEKGLLLKEDIDSKIAPVLIGDPFRINQVLMNMLSNAIKFTEKGSVTLKARLLAQEEGAQKVQIDIVDTGVGISEKYLTNIFDKFTQEDETVVRKFGGTGLGMSITKQLVELMGGTIAIHSEKNLGTTISVVFDFKLGTARVLEKKRTIKNDTANIENKKILLVEDNSLNRLLAYTILTDYGAEVVEAENGQQAVDKLKAEPFDIVLMDIQMPIMDGLQATRIIRTELKNDLPIIALTANAIKGKENEFFDAGMNDFVYKPYNEINLVNPISKWLNKLPSETPTNAAPPKPKSTTAPKAAPEPVAAKAPEPQPATAFVPPAPNLKSSEPKKAAAVETFEADGPLYDISKLQNIGSADFVKRMLRLFIEEVPPAVMNIKIAYDSGDYKTIKYLTHRIRPSIQNMGIAPLQDDVIVVEQLAMKSEKDDDLKRRIDKMNTVIDLVTDQLKKKYKL